MDKYGERGKHVTLSKHPSLPWKVKWIHIGTLFVKDSSLPLVTENTMESKFYRESPCVKDNLENLP